MKLIKQYGGGGPASAAPLATSTTPATGLANTGTALNSGAVAGVSPPATVSSAPLSSGSSFGGK